MKNLLLAAGHTTCRVNVSPKELPVLSHPYNPFADYLNGVTPLWNTSQVSVGYGMDLAHAGTTYTYAQLGLLAGGSTNVLDHQQHFASHLVVNGHAGYDWGVDTAAGRHNTMKVRASAAGRVISARYQPASEDCPGQGEVMIHHVVGASLTTPYREEFWTYYAHMDDIVVAVGDDVVESQTLGEVGFTGCTSGPTSHIHFGVHRVRNVTDALMDTPPLVPNSEQTTGRRVIDPFGWNGPSIDPWAFYAPPGFGAASMYLWRTGYAPPDWAAH